MTPSFSFEGIGTHWWIFLQGTDSTQNKKIKDDFLTILKQFDTDFSRFKEHSYVSKLNKDKEISDFPIELFDMLTYCENISFITNGYFSATAGSALNKLGYDDGYSFTQKEGTYKRGFITQLTEEKIEITDNASIDLGGIGKGWLIDKYTRYLKESGIKHFLINGGGDIYATNQPDGTPFTVQLENPFHSEETIGQIELNNAAVACSSPSRRKWSDKISGQEFHHLIDVKSGIPVDSVAAVFTYGSSSLATDASSTALFVTPPDWHKGIADFFKVEYMIISKKGQVFKTKNYPGFLLSKN